MVAIVGPTASGKTELAIRVAERINGELVSMDSRQVFRHCDIGTNKPTRAELRGIPLHGIDVADPDEPFTVADYQRVALRTISEVAGRGRLPVLQGGTGLYLRAALAELALPPAPAPGARQRWEQFYDEQGAAGAHARLEELDPAAAAAVHANDRRRVVRALELADAGASLAPGEDRLWAADTRHPTLVVGLDVPKDVLERRIEERTRAMFDDGVQEEVTRALAGTVSLTARQALGLEEVATLPRDEAIAALVVRTRRYAAYQRKWMRRIPGIAMVGADRPPGEIADDIVALARTRERVPRPRG